MSGGRHAPRLLEREGPTGLLVTTTLPALHPENETRYLSVTVIDTPEQTMGIMRAIARGPDANQFHLEPWRMFQRWLETQPPKVGIPYAEALIELIPPVAVRLRRDVRKVMTLIEAHALIHQVHRERDQANRVVADVSDYAAVYDLTADIIASGIGATVPPERPRDRAGGGNADGR